MKVIDSWNVSGLTLLTLSDSLPKTPWRRIIIDGETFEPMVPMYAGDASRAKDNAVGIKGEHDFAGKMISFV